MSLTPVQAQDRRAIDGPLDFDVPCGTHQSLQLSGPDANTPWSGGPGESHPRAPTDPCVTVSRYTALVVLVLWRAGFTQAQCAKYRGRFPAASAMARMAFLQDRSFLYFFMDHRSR